MHFDLPVNIGPGEKPVDPAPLNNIIAVEYHHQWYPGIQILTDSDGGTLRAVSSFVGRSNATVLTGPESVKWERQSADRQPHGIHRGIAWLRQIVKEANI